MAPVHPAASSHAPTAAATAASAVTGGEVGLVFGKRGSGWTLENRWTVVEATKDGRYIMPSMAHLASNPTSLANDEAPSSSEASSMWSEDQTPTAWPPHEWQLVLPRFVSGRRRRRRTYILLVAQTSPRLRGREMPDEERKRRYEKEWGERERIRIKNLKEEEKEAE